MRSASFLALSVALHVGALLYPVSLRHRIEVQFFPVTILPIEARPANGTGGGAAAKPASAAMPKTAVTASRHRPATVGNAPAPRPRSPSIAEPPASSNAAAAPFGELPQRHTSTSLDGAQSSRSDLPQAKPAAQSAAVVADQEGTIGSTGVEGFGGQGLETGTINSGDGSATGLGNGSGTGAGQGVAGDGMVLTQAGYSETPKPPYPESAQRAGREGRVVLRVLVDVHGRVRTVEVNSSSGTDALDQAAAEAIKRWRFHPARHGDKPIESWIRIPIEFRLASAKR